MALTTVQPQMAAGGPAFSAYAGSTQNLTNATWTKIAINTEEFDTNSAFDNATNYRFTPQVAGYYQVNGYVGIAPNALGFRFISIYKNGSSFKQGLNVVGAATNYTQINVSTLIYLNGSTDYIELYSQQNSGSTLATNNGSDQSYFQASMVRAA